MSDSLLDRSTLDPRRVDYLQDHLDSMMPGARVWTGHDHAMSGPDFNAMTATCRFALRGKRVFGVRMTHRWPSRIPLHQVVADIANSPAHYDAMNSETNGLGGPITEQLWRAIYNRPLGMGGGNPRRSGYVAVQERGDLGEAPSPRRPRRPAAEPFVTTKRPVFMTAALKAHLFSALRLLLERDRLLIPTSAEDLYRELLLLKVDLTATGERIEAASGHDDLAMSLALSLYPYKDQNGAWRTRLSDYADPAVYRLPEPELPAAMDRVELIPGPGDLMIPRTLAWVSTRARI